MASNERRNRIEIGLATLIGVLALAVSGWSAYWQRTQARAQTWPHVEIDDDIETRGSTDMGLLTGAYKIKLVNGGSGPAIVHRLTATLDGKPMKNLPAAIYALQLPHRSVPFLSYDSDHAVIGAGATKLLLDMPDPEQAFALAGQRQRIHVTVCYCSVLEECWLASQDDLVSVRRCETP